jgi:UPF0271 protein
MAIDLNADVGEGFADAQLISLVSSVNVACGAHAGDGTTIEQTIALALAAGAAVGAHPSYPDREGFGRREMDLDPDELARSLTEQIRAVLEAAETAGARCRHVKPHGALYNRAARDPVIADLVARTVRAVSADLVLVGLAGSCSLDAARAVGLETAAEAFADRRYEPDGRLRDRRHADALLHDPAEAAAQAVSIVRDGHTTASDGSRLAVAADTLCIHGDAPGAADRARAVRRALTVAGIEIRPFGP